MSDFITSALLVDYAPRGSDEYEGVYMGRLLENPPRFIPYIRVGDLPETEYHEGDIVRLLNDRLVLMAKIGDELMVKRIDYAKVSRERGYEDVVEETKFGSVVKGNSRYFFIGDPGKGFSSRVSASDVELVERGPHW